MNRPFAPAASGVRRGPEHYWRQAQRFGAKGFTVTELQAKCKSAAHKTVQQYVYTLRDCGAVAAIGTAKGRTGKVATRYAVVKHLPAAPVRRRPGPPSVRGRIQKNLWNAMRRLKDFGVRELAIAASTDELAVSLDTTGLYVRRLLKADLVAVIEPGERSRRGVQGATPGTYALRPTADTGPWPLKIIGNRVFDPNARRFVGQPIDGSELANEVLA